MAQSQETYAAPLATTYAAPPVTYAAPAISTAPQSGLFNQFDANRDGAISRQEFAQATMTTTSAVSAMPAVGAASYGASYTSSAPVQYAAPAQTAVTYAAPQQQFTQQFAT